MKLSFRKALALAFMTIVLCGCKGKNQGGETSDENPGEIANGQLFTKGTILYQNANLYQEKADGQMLYFDKIDKGSEVKIYLSGKEENESKNITLTGENSEEKMIHISYFDKDFWIKRSFIAPNTVPAVIKEEASIYSQADKASKSSRTLKKGEIVAIGGEKKDFVTIFVYDGNEFGEKLFVKKSLLTKKADDILAQQIYDKISGRTKREVLLELKDGLSQLQISSEIRQEIELPEESSKKSEVAADSQKTGKETEEETQVPQVQVQVVTPAAAAGNDTFKEE